METKSSSGRTKLMPTQVSSFASMLACTVSKAEQRLRKNLLREGGRAGSGRCSGLQPGRPARPAACRTARFVFRPASAWPTSSRSAALPRAAPRPAVVAGTAQRPADRPTAAPRSSRSAARSVRRARRQVSPSVPGTGCSGRPRDWPPRRPIRRCARLRARQSGRTWRRTGRARSRPREGDKATHRKCVDQLVVKRLVGCGDIAGKIEAGMSGAVQGRFERSSTLMDRRIGRLHLRRGSMSRHTPRRESARAGRRPWESR